MERRKKLTIDRKGGCAAFWDLFVYNLSDKRKSVRQSVCPAALL